jgi:hypothetical protein
MCAYGKIAGSTERQIADSSEMTLAELLFIARNIRTVRNKISKTGSKQYRRPLAKSLLNRVRNNEIADFFYYRFRGFLILYEVSQISPKKKSIYGV